MSRFVPVVVDDDIATLKNIVEADVPAKVLTPHWHVVTYPGPKVLCGPITERISADRIAMNVSIAHPDKQIHVKGCTGKWCLR